jgi:hypothetical protein
MPNPIKYNTSAETLALKKGNFWIGTGDVGKGPTSSTGFYNGITPPSGGYTIYLNKASGGPSIYTVSTEAELTGLTNTISVSTNLIKNNNGGNFANGTVAPFNGSYGTLPTIVDITNDKPYNGSTSTKAAKFVAGGGMNIATSPSPFTMTVGVTYTFSFWYRQTNSNNFYIAFNNQGGSGDVNGNFQAYSSYGMFPNPTQTWQRCSWTFTNVVDKFYFFIYSMGSVAGSECLMTEFTLTEGSMPGGPGLTTSGQCLNWFATQTDKMIFNRDYEPIITDGLIMNLDAGFALSYPTMGTTLYDLSGKGNGGTLINGPTFSTNGGGSIHLDGVDDRIDIPKDMSGLTHNIQYDINWTVECWMYMYTPDTSPQVYKQIFGNYNGCNYDALPGNAAGFFIYDANSSSNVYCYFAFGPKNNPGGGQCPTIDFSWNNSESSWVYSSAINKWCHFVMTSDDGTNYKLFINGVQQGATKTANFKNSQLRTDNNLTSTYNYSFGGQSIGYNEVDFGIMRMYNKPLSQVEITQNYNAQKGRYGL